MAARKRKEAAGGTPRAGASGQASAAGAARCRRKFLRHFPGGFRDETYLDWERDYKWVAHEQWASALGETEFRTLIAQEQFTEVALRAVRVESRTNLLFSFEKMALRDAVRSDRGAEQFALGLFAFLHGGEDPAAQFDAWCAVIAAL